ncbi:hypothetical protein GGX14DRAFT_537128 [Mycena pura]|uniref:Uncharacterized protein n=1 Tax=Mycena pura TaxID=153505 RepID=A0AAD6UY29_9AGAR|nr:hypothetical protein GGX14DRAFT_537128 [Mycena pura]
MSATRYGLPYMLEDTTGSLSGSEFVDIHERMHFAVRCTLRDARQTVYMIYNMGPAPLQRAVHLPLAGLTFGADNALGTISFAGVPMPMRNYLFKPPQRVPSLAVSPAILLRCIASGSSSSHKVRRFVASDGQTYQWARRTQPNQEWTCTNSNALIVASYSLKTAGEPEYNRSSGCILELAEECGNLAPDILASLWIMRHIVEYNL